MTKKLVVAAVVVLFAIAASWGLFALMASGRSVGKEEYAVYSAVLNSRVLGQISRHPERLLIRGRTEKHVPLDMISSLQSLVSYRFDPRRWWLHRTLIAKSLSEAALVDDFETSYPHEVIHPVGEFDPSVRDLPYAQFSRVGFSPMGGSALVYLRYYCGSLCGIDEYILLRRDSTGWTVVEEWVVGVS